MLLLATALVGISLEFKPSRKAKTARAVGAVLAAALLMIAAATPTDPSPPTRAGLD